MSDDNKDTDGAVKLIYIRYSLVSASCNRNNAMKTAPIPSGLVLFCTDMWGWHFTSLMDSPISAVMTEVQRNCAEYAPARVLQAERLGTAAKVQYLRWWKNRMSLSSSTDIKVDEMIVLWIRKGRVFNSIRHVDLKLLSRDESWMVKCLCDSGRRCWGGRWIIWTSGGKLTLWSSVCVFSELYQSLQELPAAAVSSVSVQSDWGRFLYNTFSLCEHILTVDIMLTLTVVNCCIFSLNSTDGQSEVRVWSTAWKTIWNPWFLSGSRVNEQFRSFSISLLVPG